MRGILRVLPRAGLALPLLLHPAAVAALTWEFDDPVELAGWRAEESWASGGARAGTPLRTTVEDGVWRIWLTEPAPGGAPSLQLYTPDIRQSAGRFDQLRFRIRLMEGDPVRAQVTSRAVFERNGQQRTGNRRAQLCVLTTAWQEIEASSMTGTGAEGELLVRAEVYVVGAPDQYTGDLDPEALLPGLDLDWITITGMGEQIEGEEPLGPPATPEFVHEGELLGEAEFSRLVEGVGDEERSDTPGALGDADGDGDLDLVALWFQGQSAGFVVAANDGEGRFAPADQIVLQASSEGAWGGRLWAADLDGDGLVDVLPYYGGQLGVLWNRGDGEWVTVPVGEEYLPYVQWIAPAASGQGSAAWLYNEAEGRAEALRIGERGEVVLRPWEAVLPLGVTAFRPLRSHPGQQTVNAWWCPLADDWSPESPGDLRTADRGRVMVGHVDPAGVLQTEQYELGVNVISLLARRVADLDEDGVPDVLLNCTQVNGRFQGLNWRHLDATGVAHEDTVASWYVSASTVPPAATDLDQDGHLDLLLAQTGGGSTARGLAVLRGTAGGGWSVEGFYPLTGQLGAVSVGDVDADGDDDALVLCSSRYGEGGVYVLKSRLSEGITAVAEQAPAPRPTGLRVRAYPNPANPQTVIEYTLPGTPGPVDLAVYDAVGQRVRTLFDGAVAAPGTHSVTWAGTDEVGRPVASGVYLVRLQAGALRQVCRLSVVR